MSVVDVVVVWLYYYGSLKKQVIISPKTNRHKIKRFDLRSACPRQNLSQLFFIECGRSNYRSNAFVPWSFCVILVDI